MTTQYAHPYPQYAARNGLGIAAIIVALAALPFTLSGSTAWIAIVAGMVAVPLALTGLGRVRRHPATNRGTTISGIVAGLLAMTVGIISTSVAVIALAASLA